MSDTDISKYIALILRHKPETIGISLYEHGWADVKELIEGVGRTYPIDMEVLKRIVANDEKGRYSFNEDQSKIRANQGHSIAVDVELKEAVPPEILYHGTGEKFTPYIDEEGLKPKSRLYVHLSQDEKTALKVGSRHGKPIVYEVKAGEMAKDGHVFYLSANGVWLIKQVPVRYLNKLK